MDSETIDDTMIVKTRMGARNLQVICVKYGKSNNKLKTYSCKSRGKNAIGDLCTS